MKRKNKPSAKAKVVKKDNMPLSVAADIASSLEAAGWNVVTFSKLPQEDALPEEAD